MGRSRVTWHPLRAGADGVLEEAAEGLGMSAFEGKRETGTTKTLLRCGGDPPVHPNQEHDPAWQENRLTQQHRPEESRVFENEGR